MKCRISIGKKVESKLKGHSGPAIVNLFHGIVVELLDWLHVVLGHLVIVRLLQNRQQFRHLFLFFVCKTVVVLANEPDLSHCFIDDQHIASFEVGRFSEISLEKYFFSETSPVEVDLVPLAKIDNGLVHTSDD